MIYKHIMFYMKRYTNEETQGRTLGLAVPGRKNKNAALGYFEIWGKTQNYMPPDRNDEPREKLKIAGDPHDCDLLI